MGYVPKMQRGAHEAMRALMRPSGLARVRAADTEALSVVPKDPNWDLKRDIEPKLAILRKRTQKAIVATLRERLKKESR